MDGGKDDIDVSLAATPTHSHGADDDHTRVTEITKEVSDHEGSQAIQTRGRLISEQHIRVGDATTA